MPFQSEKQRRYLWANEPKIAREWTDRYGASEGGITRLRQAYPNNMTVGEEMINIDFKTRDLSGYSVLCNLLFFHVLF